MKLKDQLTNKIESHLNKMEELSQDKNNPIGLLIAVIKELKARSLEDIDLLLESELINLDTWTKMFDHIIQMEQRYESILLINRKGK